MKRKIYFWLIALAALIIAIVPQAAFAGTEDGAASNAIAGTIAHVTWDENGSESYDTSGKVTLQVEPGSILEWFAIGTGTGDNFQPLSGNPDSYTISVKKDGWSEAATKENPSGTEPLYVGAFLGWYDESEEAVQLGYNGNAILLGEESYGTYDITVVWEEGGKTYTATTILTLEETNTIVRGFFGESDQYEKSQGFLRTWYTWAKTEKNADGKFQLYYEPYYDYTEEYTMLYTDGEHGILNFVNSDCGANGLFVAGDPVEYKEDLQVIPLQIDYSKITADMVGKTYTLKFIDAKGNNITCEVVIAYKNELSYLVDGQVYAIDSGKVKEDGKLYIANQDELLESLIKSEIVAEVDRGMRYHFGIWDETNKNFTPVAISCSDPAVDVSGNSEDGYILYATAETNGNFTTENEKIIAYSFSLPESGFYRAPVRSVENYLGYKVYLAEEDVSSDEYDFYYMVQADTTFEKADLNVEYKELDGVTVEETNDWTSASGKKYYVWRIHMESRVVDQPDFDEEIWLDVSAKKDGRYFGVYDWINIYGTNAVPESQQLYWFNEWEITGISEDGKIVGFDDEDGWTLDDYAKSKLWRNGRASGCDGYFAVKKDGEYYIVNDVTIDEEAGITLTKSANTSCLYEINWTEFGEYHFTATFNEKEYRINLVVELPSVGIYSTRDRSGDTYLDNEFHYVSAAEKNDDGTEAYFYLIAPTYGYTANQIKLSFGEWIWNSENTEAVWKEKSVSGLSVGNPAIQNFENEEYTVYKITVANEYRSTYNYSGEVESIKVKYCRGETYEEQYIYIYDSTEILEEEQLYYFHPYDVEVGEDGKIQLSGTGEYTIDDVAVKIITGDVRCGTEYLCFGVKINGEYYAVENAEVAETTGVSLTKSSDTQYLYTVKWTEFGEYQITATANGKEYRINLVVELPEVGFYSTRDKSGDTYLDNEFHYVTATEKNTDGTEAYFYLIAPTYGYTANQIKLSFGERVWNNVDEKYVWKEQIINGLSANNPEIETSKKEEYAVWKITVAEMYRNQKDTQQTMKIAYEDGYISVNTNIYIYDSAEIPEDEQLYWIEDIGNDYENLYAESDGEIIYTVRYFDWSVDRLIKKKIKTTYNTSNTVGYFVVERDGKYYALDDVRVDETEGLTLTKSSDNAYLYTVKWTKFGERQIVSENGGKEYRITFTATLPEVGFYSTSIRSEEAYLDEFYYATAVERSEDGKEAYFYWIAPSNGYSAEQIKVYLGEDSWSEDGTYEWIEKDIEGITIGDIDVKEMDGESYAVCKIKIEEMYTGGNIKKFRMKCDDDVLHEDYLLIYDASEIPEEQQLYWFSKYDTNVNDEGKIRLSNEEEERTVGDIANTGLSATNKSGTQSLRFGVKIDDEYFAVTNLTVSGGNDISLKRSSDDEYEYILEWTEIGEYIITAEYKGKKYRMRFIAELPVVGFYATSDRSGDSYLGYEFHYITADDKDADGTKAYFYMIAPSNGYESNEIEVFNRKYQEKFGWVKTSINGITIGDVEIKEQDGENYAVCRIAVDSTYTSDEHVDFAVKYGENVRYEKNIYIYDAREIPEEEQLYYCLSWSVTVNDEGELVVAKSEYGDVGNFASTNFYVGTNNYDYYGVYYFAVKDGDRYYPVTNVSAPKEIEIHLDDDGTYKCRINKIGEYEITATYQGKTYRLRSVRSLPNFGYFAKDEMTAENYLYEEFRIRDAVEKNGDGTECYFYLFWLYEPENTEDENIHLECWDRIDGDSKGLTIEKQKELTIDAQTYLLYKITVPSTYTAENNYKEKWVVTDKEKFYAFTLYTLSFGDIDGNGKIDFADALYLKRYLANWDNYSLIDAGAADLNADDKVDNADVMILERHIAGWKGYDTLPRVIETQAS